MSWLHISAVKRDDGATDWLIVTGIDAPLFDWGIRTSVPLHLLTRLPTLRGWMVRSEAESTMWAVVAECVSPIYVCLHCLHHAEPCEAWERIVARRFAFHQARQRSPVDDAEPSQADPWRRRRRRVGDLPPPTRHAIPPPAPDTPDPRHVAAERLAVSWPCDRATVKTAFKRAALKSHPDLGGTDASMIELIRARDVLLASVDVNSQD